MASPPTDTVALAREHLDREDLTLSALAHRVGEAPHTLRRAFIDRFGLSPAQYRAQSRVERLRKHLRAGDEVSAAVYGAGYGSPSRVYQDGAARLGMTPASYRRGGEGMSIYYTVVECPLGRALVATTRRGVCSVALGGSAAGLEAGLAAEFPRARIERVDAGSPEFVAPRVAAVAAALAGRSGGADVRVELLGTAFQFRVWEALMRIPAGQTRTYAELARELGQPAAVRAVAGACARNKVAVLVPCHRVVRSDGSLGGYRWGLPRKQALLDREAGAAG
ncbi:methylated-DNA--[protein]-cysteine S-methyltransferase [Alkalisalibacterium limincola]|uniref:methylated-DNA--[protein]-cysteine S-methyltransferase n=1 Tax=Alkalisalibacterium limincola TaxID=2699169 RepID=UPI0021064AE6|nr:methylated-DNA--[protein]-cysteine S-methyltransferase [Alkalisalibacterium limincola]